MFDIPTKEQWQSLFETAASLNNKELWKIFPEELIFAFPSEAENDAFYVTVHGYEEEVLGISVYAGKEDIEKYLRILEQGDDVSFYTILENQSCVTALFGEEIHLGPGDFTAMQEGGYQPDSVLPHNCIYFRSYRPGMAPWYIDRKEADLLIKGLNAFEKAAAGFSEPPENAAEVMVVYRENEDRTEVIPFDESLKTAKADIVKDDFYIARLKQLKRTGRSIELDILYMNNPVSGQLSSVPFFPKMCIIGDADEGCIADQCIFEETTEEEEAFYSFLAAYLKKNGLPRKISIRSDSAGPFMRDLCKKLRITLQESKELPLIDDFMSMINGLGMGE